MTNKIPPSLNWLIDKYARTSGQINKLKEKLSNVQQWVDQLNELEETLGVIENTLKLHEIQIDVENIKPVQPSMLITNKFKRGEPEKLAVEFLKSRYGLGPVSKDEIVEFLIEEHTKLAPNITQPAKEFRRFTQGLLKRLANKNCVIRLHSKSSTTGGLWEINPKLISPKSKFSLNSD